ASPRRDGARLFLPPRHTPGHANGRTCRRGRPHGGGSVERASGAGARGPVLALRRGASFAASCGGSRAASEGGAVPHERRPGRGAGARLRRSSHGTGQGADLPGAADRGERRAGRAGARAPGAAGCVGAGRRARGVVVSLVGGPAGEGRVPRLEPGLHLPSGASGVPLSRSTAGRDADAEAGRADGGGGGIESAVAQCAAACVAEGGVMRGQPGVIRVALGFAALLASLSLVIWRQSRALEVLRALDGVRRERAVLEAERATELQRIRRLESRSRVVAEAGKTLGM